MAGMTDRYSFILVCLVALEPAEPSLDLDASTFGIYWLKSTQEKEEKQQKTHSQPGFNTGLHHHFIDQTDF